MPCSRVKRLFGCSSAVGSSADGVGVAPGQDRGHGFGGGGGDAGGVAEPGGVVGQASQVRELLRIDAVVVVEDRRQRELVEHDQDDGRRGPDGGGVAGGRGRIQDQAPDGVGGQEPGRRAGGGRRRGAGATGGAPSHRVTACHSTAPPATASSTVTGPGRPASPRRRTTTRPPRPPSRSRCTPSRDWSPCRPLRSQSDQLLDGEQDERAGRARSTGSGRRCRGDRPAG